MNPVEEKVKEDENTATKRVATVVQHKFAIFIETHRTLSAKEEKLFGRILQIQIISIMRNTSLSEFLFLVVCIGLKQLFDSPLFIEHSFLQKEEMVKDHRG